MTTIIFLNFFTWIHQSCSQIIWFKKTENILDFVFSLIEKFWLDWFFLCLRSEPVAPEEHFIRSRKLNLNKWQKSSILITISWKNTFILTYDYNCSILRFLRLFSSWRKCNLYLPSYLVHLERSKLVKSQDVFLFYRKRYSIPCFFFLLLFFPGWPDQKKLTKRGRETNRHFLWRIRFYYIASTALVKVLKNV